MTKGSQLGRGEKRFGREHIRHFNPTEVSAYYPYLKHTLKLRKLRGEARPYRCPEGPPEAWGLRGLDQGAPPPLGGGG